MPWEPNVFRYVKGNPVRKMDPFGLCELEGQLGIYILVLRGKIGWNDDGWYVDLKIGTGGWGGSLEWDPEGDPPDHLVTTDSTSMVAAMGVCEVEEGTFATGPLNQTKGEEYYWLIGIKKMEDNWIPKGLGPESKTFGNSPVLEYSRPVDDQGFSKRGWKLGLGADYLIGIHVGCGGDL